MADPFEVRMRFTSQLQHLNASVTSAQKTAHYALKHREMDEDLHSCILEQLERNNMNNRANIMYFFEALCDRARHENHPEFIRMMERDILKIIDLVAPDDNGGPGAANVKVVRKVLNSLQEKSYLNPKTVVELEEFIKDRDKSMMMMDDDEENGGVGAGGQYGAGGASGENGSGPVEGVGGESGETNGPRGVREVGRGEPNNSGRRLDKRQIEQRIEEDRERHKRLRESIWAVPHDVDPDAEYWRMMDETSDIGDDDYAMAAEEAEERKRCAETHHLEMAVIV
ncbi:hypothetical protein AAFC00_005713 [Neodothiora populina]|uniref:CID domain-containing protein n=1 Tax=Neodothiora populina TaxID=2781224 RepID=A0ABR3P5S3_9PEZI